MHECLTSAYTDEEKIDLVGDVLDTIRFEEPQDNE